jgi:hypothetical protein
MESLPLGGTPSPPTLAYWRKVLVVAYLVYRAAREALGRTDLPVFVDAWEGFPGAPTSGSSRASGTGPSQEASSWRRELRIGRVRRSAVCAPSYVFACPEMVIWKRPGPGPSPPGGV